MDYNNLPSRTMKYKPDFNECIARIYAWYEQKIIDRPPVRFHHHNIEYERARTIEGSWDSVEARWLDVDFQLKTYMDSLEETELLGETFPIYWPNLSAVVYNMFLGQKVDFDDATAWTRECVDDMNNIPDIKFQWDGIYCKTIEEMTQKAIERAEGKFMVGYTDMYAGIDCAAGLRGTEHLCMDLIMNPDGVNKLIDMGFVDYFKAYDHFDKILKDNGHLSATWMNLPSFEKANVLAADFAVNISTDHFDEFCMPVLRREAEHFTHNAFHLDSPGVAKNIDSILTLPNLPVIQWVQGYGDDTPIMQWLPLIEKIQAAGKSVIVDLQLDELDEFMKKADPTGIMLWIPADPKDQQGVLDKVNNW